MPLNDDFTHADIMKAMTPAERSAAAKKGWETRRRKGFRSKAKLVTGAPKLKLADALVEASGMSDSEVQRRLAEKRAADRKPGAITRERAVEQLGAGWGSKKDRSAAVARVAEKGKGSAATRAERTAELVAAAKRDSTLAEKRRSKRRGEKRVEADAEYEARLVMGKYGGRGQYVYDYAVEDLDEQIDDAERSAAYWSRERRDAAPSDREDMPSAKEYSDRVRTLKAARNKVVAEWEKSLRPNKPKPLPKITSAEVEVEASEIIALYGRGGTKNVVKALRTSIKMDERRLKRLQKLWKPTADSTPWSRKQDHIELTFSERNLEVERAALALLETMSDDDMTKLVDRYSSRDHVDMMNTRYDLVATSLGYTVD